MEFTRSATFSSIKFPQLAPRYQGMPRRYEETKPVVIQDFTHRKIVGKLIKLYLLKKQTNCVTYSQCPTRTMHINVNHRKGNTRNGISEWHTSFILLILVLYFSD